MGEKEEFSGPTFRPSREGLGKVLGDLEAAVMEYIWQASEPVTARVVAENVGEQRGVQYITVITVLNNLWRKKLLSRRKSGRALKYKPRMERDEFLRQVSRDVFSGMMDLGPQMAVNSFIDVLAELAPGEIERLKRKLAKKRRTEK